MKKIISVFLLMMPMLWVHSQSDSLISYVDPFIGTGGHGHTFPGATIPFGMVQLSPDTRLEGWDGCSGYHYSDSVVYGFSHTHLSGTGVSDYGDILFMPVTGKPHFNNGAKNPDSGYASRFSHTNETASPGFYSVFLDDYQIRVDLTASTRAGYQRYTFPKEEEAYVVLDLEHRDKVIDNQLIIINDSTIAGKRVSDAWAREQHVYFYTIFSEPFMAFEVNQKTGDSIISGKQGIKAWFSFPMAGQVLVKTGISAVDIEGAKQNLKREIPHQDFVKIRTNAQKAWEQELSKIKVEGGTVDQKINFYTALYHAFIHPNTYYDVDGRYRGRDMKIHRLEPGEQHYTVFSLWDTFRAAHPLFTLIQPEKTLHFIKTMLRQYRQGGRLPVWELAANETDCMIGYHAVPVIADAFLKGYDEFDEELALEAMVNCAMEDRYGLDDYKALGFIRAENEGESVSKTLEYAYDDWCIAQMAEQIGKPDLHRAFLKRAQNWKNLYDPDSKFMRAKTHGHWFKPFDPAEVNYHYTEANAWQYNFFVPQDIQTMISFMGGPAAFDAFLSRLFTTGSETTGRHQADITGLIGQYAHGNEPSHHMAYLFNYAQKPWKTQKYVRQIMETMYSPNPGGLSGNEDCGQMSAWYVFGAMGFYPVTPADSFYAIGAPLFDKITLNAGKNPLIIEAENANQPFVKEVYLNGAPYRKALLPHQQIIEGGKLQFRMQKEPNQGWFNVFPEREITGHQTIPVPFIKSGDRSFEEATLAELSCADTAAEIFYALSSPDSAYQKYRGPFKISRSDKVYAYSKNGSKKSSIVPFSFNQIPEGLEITLHSDYAGQYAAGGDKALIDGLKGGEDYRTGTWQGFQGKDLEFVVDRGNSGRIDNVKLGFLQDSRSWILLPEYVEFSFSEDGEVYSDPVKIKNPHPKDTEEAFIHRFETNPGKKARYVKVFAKSAGKLPDWHKGSGGSSWLFADEIEILKSL